MKSAANNLILSGAVLADNYRANGGVGTHAPHTFRREFQGFFAKTIHSLIGLGYCTCRPRLPENSPCSWGAGPRFWRPSRTQTRARPLVAQCPLLIEQ